MKRLLTLILLVLMISCSAQAEGIDLGSLSFDELLSLQAQVNQALFNCAEWKEVEVPMGIWDIGKDIPAGRWELSRSKKADSYYKTSIAYYLKRTNGQPDYYRGTYYLKTAEDVVVLELEEGNVIKIEDGSVIFRRYVPSFTFD